MDIILLMVTLQGLLGAFDTLYHHEFKERLPWRPTARQELWIHSVRNFFYAIIFISLGWLQWQGLWAWLFMAILITEVLLTLWDFVVEDQTRRLPASERITHTILAINYGAILALLIPELLEWSVAPSQFVAVHYGIWSYIMAFFVLGVSLWSIRDWVSAHRNSPSILSSIQLVVPKQRVLITGGSGFIGSRLGQALINDGHHVTVLTRDKTRTAAMFKGEITLIDEIRYADHYDVIINLAGEPIGNGRWTKKKKQAIYDSRLNMTHALIDYIANVDCRPSLLINGSAIGYYGSHLDQTFTEDSGPAEHKLPHDLCRQWEAIAAQASQYGVRVANLRTGIVLGTEGGALAQMLFPFEFGLGGKMGSGKQWMSWIHIDDVIGIIGTIINHTIEGPVNITAPEPVTNAVFTKALGKALKRPVFMSIPSISLRLMLGEMGEELLLKGQKVLPQKLLDHGYQFQYPTIESALNQLLRGQHDIA